MIEHSKYIVLLYIKINRYNSECVSFELDILEVIKDYKLNYHDSEVLSKIANRNFIERIFKIICITEEIQIQLFKNFWNFPRTIKESSQIIFSLEKNQ